MDRESLRHLLSLVSGGELGIDQALARLELLPYACVKDARLDLHRSLRQGFPEVILGEGKTPQQVARNLAMLHEYHKLVLCTRANADQAQAARQQVSNCQYDAVSRILFCAPNEIPERGRGTVCVIAAGTADLPVAREACWTAFLMGNRVDFIIDVGVAGLHRLMSELERVRSAEVLIVVAGMEGALPSVVGGLCNRPIIAVPTSVGYGSGQGGWAALLGMLNSCAAGISVVNIDNGFGAGYSAALINRRREDTPTQLMPLSNIYQILGITRSDTEL